MRIRSIIFLVVVMFSMCGVSGQKTGIMIVAGLNSNTMTETGTRSSYSSSSLNSDEPRIIYTLGNKTGYHVGVTYDLPVNNSFFWGGGLFLDTRGATMDGRSSYDPSYGSISVKGDVSINTLTIVPTMKYIHSFNNVFRIYGQTGFYTNVHLSGKVNTVAENENTRAEVKGKIDFGFGDDEMMPIDYGVNLGAGIEISHVVLGLGFDTSLYSGGFSKYNSSKVKFSAFKVSLGYRI